jgi:hypothetical protein
MLLFSALLLLQLSALLLLQLSPLLLLLVQKMLTNSWSQKNRQKWRIRLRSPFRGSWLRLRPTT